MTAPLAIPTVTTTRRASEASRFRQTAMMPWRSPVSCPCGEGRTGGALRSAARGGGGGGGGARPATGRRRPQSIAALLGYRG